MTAPAAPHGAGATGAGRFDAVPLRWRLVGAAMVLVTLALAGTGLVSTTALRGYLLDRVDGQLRVSASEILNRTPGRGGAGMFGGASLAQAPGRAAYLQVSDAAGAVVDARILAPAGTQQAPPLLPALGPERVASRDGNPFTVRADGAGYRWRVLVASLPQSAGSITVGLSLDDIDSTVARLRRITMVIGVTALVLLGALGYLLVRRSLRPLETVEATARAIAAGDLARRVPDMDDRTEIGRLGAAVNTMLGQIETAFRAREASEASARAAADRMRRFVADASHELRTPLTSIRGFAELYRQGAIGDEDTPRIMGRIESEAARMGSLVEDLLLLARLDQQRPLERAPVDLLRLASDAVQDAAAVSPQRSTHLEATTSCAVVLGDEGRLRQVLGNLVGNALRHTPPGTSVAVRVSTEAGSAVVEVADDGPGISAADQERIFERFYRADPSRGREAGGAGLGLAIVAALVTAHGGTVDVHSEPGRGARFAVRLPLLDPSTSGAVPAAQPASAVLPAWASPAEPGTPPASPTGPGPSSASPTGPGPSSGPTAEPSEPGATSAGSPTLAPPQQP